MLMLKKYFKTLDTEAKLYVMIIQAVMKSAG